MIRNTDVSEFIGNLSQHLQVLITRIGNQETWSSDNDDDVNALIDQLSVQMASTNPETLSKASSLLLTNSAYFNLPRFLKFITFIAEKNPRAINQMLSPLNKEKIQDGEVYLNTVVSRLRYMIQSILVTEIFSPEIMKRVQVAVLTHENLKREKDASEIEASESNRAKDTVNSPAENHKPEQTTESDVHETDTLKSGTQTEPLKETADDPIKAKIKSKASKKMNYQFRKDAVLDLLNKMKDEATNTDK